MRSSTVGVISSEFAKLNHRAFLVGLDKADAKRPLVTIHARRELAADVDPKALARHFADLGVQARFRVRRHKKRSLDRAVSLQKLVGQFKHAEIVCDPTRAITRAGDLVRFAGQLRKTYHRSIAGIYWCSQWRKLYVVFDEAEFVNDRTLKVADLAEAEDHVVAALKESIGDQLGDYIPAVQLGFEFPKVPVVAVDEASHYSSQKMLGWFARQAKRSVLSAALGLGLAGTAAAQSYDRASNVSEPAVSAPNAKLSVRGGFLDENQAGTDGTGLAAGSFLFPLGHSFGGQIDGVAGFRDDNFVGGAGLHLFWRDPAVGQFGPFGSFSVIDRNGNLVDQEVGLVGGEGEIYLNDLTIFAAAGGSFGKGIEDGFFGKAEVLWYLSNDFLFRAGGEYSEEREGLGTVGMEFQPGFEGLPGLTAFAEGKFGANDFAKVTVGFRYYFGQTKSLKDRHRRDDWAWNAPDAALDHATARQATGGVASTAMPPTMTGTPMMTTS